MKSAVVIIALLLLVVGNTSGQEERIPKNVAIFVFKDVQVIDFTGPYEVFVNASSGEFSQFNVFTVAETMDTITTVGNLKIMPAYTFANHPKPDVIVLPGGWGVYPQWKRPAVSNWIREQAKDAEIVLSVCNGAIFLATTGLLDSLSATSTSGFIDELAKEVPGLKPVYDKRYVDNGKIITSAGLSAGIDGALHVVERMLGKGWAQRIAIDMEYNWQPNSTYARALLADQYIPPAWWLFRGLINDPVSYSGNTTEWETKDIIHTTRTTKAVMDSIITKIEGNKSLEKWKRISVNCSGQNCVSKWLFTDKKERKWRASFEVQQINTPGRQLVTATIKQQ